MASFPCIVHLLATNQYINSFFKADFNNLFNQLQLNSLLFNIHISTTHTTYCMVPTFIIQIMYFHQFSTLETIIATIS